MITGESRFMEPLLLAGRIIMENGGETYRVEETITRMGQAFGLTDVESFAVPSGVFVSYKKSNGETETSVLRVRARATNLRRVDEVNSVSRRVGSGEMTCEEAVVRLREIMQLPGVVPPVWLPFAAAVSAGGFSLLFGGGMVDFVLSGAVTLLVQLASMLLGRIRIESLVNTLVASFLATFIPLMLHAFTSLGVTDAIIAGALMPMLPGLAMTNAVQDTVRGDILSGMSHGIQALFTAGVVAGGALMASALFYLMMGGGV